jgi:cation diffusion facilitator family transporter
MILVAAVGILLSAWERLQHPQGLEALDIGILISIAAAILNGGMALTLLRAGRRFQSITLEADGRHLMTDVWTTVAILLGLGGLALTGWLWLDSVIAMLAALNIVSSGVTLIRRSLSGLLGVALPVEERQLVEAILEKYRRQGIQFHDLRARIAGSHRLITLHVLVPGDMAVQQAHELMENIEGDIRARLQNLLVVTHVEPLDDPASFRHDIL